jgi:hypothetical protein
MLRFIGWIVLMAGAFGMGYYVAQHPDVSLRNAVADLSRDVLGRTLDVERGLKTRQGLVDAKSRLIQAKSEILDRNYGNATKALAETALYLEQVPLAASEAEQEKVRSLIKQVREVELQLSQGKRVARSRLDEIQRDLDALLTG